MSTFKAGISAWLAERFERFLNKVSPRAHQIRLNHRSLLVLPTKAGLGLLGCALLIWLLGTNYSNNLVLVLAYFLVALLVVSIHLSFANVSGLKLRAKQSPEGFVGDELAFQVELESQGGYRVAALELFFKPLEGAPQKTFIDYQSASLETSQVFVRAAYRGVLNPGRLCVSSRFPFGLVRVWTWVDLDFQALVYPEPVVCELPAMVGTGDDHGESQLVTTGDDFYGLNQYQPGDSLSRIAWKQFARGQGLTTKEFSQPGQNPEHLHWQMFPGLDTEARLSRLCYLVLMLDKARRPFALQLPGVDLAFGLGPKHRLEALRALARFGQSAELLEAEAAPSSGLL